MDEEDELALKLINAKAITPITEDQFEEVMTFFEEIVPIEQPFAGVTETPVLPFEKLMEHIDGSTPPAVQAYAKVVYEHWSGRRIAKKNHSLPPQLKFETNTEGDDGDPYVCFRRREIRHTRKTRQRDTLSADKLIRLRKELDTARNLLLLVKQREQARLEQLIAEKQVFEQRQAFRELKRKLKQSGDDDLLITQKKPKLPPVVPPEQQLTQPLPTRSGPELKTLEDLRIDKERAMQHEIQTNVDKHIRWNDGFHDKTMAPLTPVTEAAEETSFLPAVTATYLPTPPASISEDEAVAEKPGATPEIEMKDASRASTPFRYASPDVDDEHKPSMPAFRMRIGRGGRRLMDRKLPFRAFRQYSQDDRFKFDRDSDDEMDLDDEEGSFLAQSARQSNERSGLLAPRIALPSANSLTPSTAQRQIESASLGSQPVQQQQIAGR